MSRAPLTPSPPRTPPAAVHLRPARKADCPQMGQILLGWVEETPWMPRIHPRESYGGFAELLKNVGEVTVATEGPGGKVLGFIARQDEDIQALYVASDARGRGVGKALLDHLKRRHGRLVLWTFQANEGARRFYGREGFREAVFTDGQGNDEKLPDLQMIWERARHERL